MTLELRLDWKTLKQEECPHTALRYDGVMMDTIPIVTCYHPNAPHCGGTFDARNFNKNGAVLYKGQMYCVDYLRDWNVPA